MEIKSRHAADPDLNLMAKRLSTVRWLAPLTAEEEAACLRLQKAESPPRHLNLMLDYKTWAVRLYLGGAQRTIGMYKPPVAAGGDFSAAVRYADMAKMMFWKYNIRGAHEPDDSELNLTALRARQDLAGEPEASGLLLDIEQYLIGIRAILSPEERERKRKEDRAHQRRSTLTTVVAETSVVTQELLLRIEKRLATQEEQLARVNGFIERLLMVREQSASAFIPPLDAPPVPATGDPVPQQPIVTC